MKVAPADEGALRKVMGALVARATNNLTREGVLARASVFASASPAFVDDIAKFTTYDDTYWAMHFPASDGYEALADINTPSARAHLRRLYDESSSLNRRLDIVHALSRLPETDNFEFLSTLLPGRSTPADDEIRMAAVEGLICIGGEAAAGAVVSHVATLSDVDKRFNVLTRTGSKVAVDAIVAMPLPASGVELLQACESLASLTHVDWCADERLQDVVLDNSSDRQRKLRDLARSLNRAWVRWWSRNRASARVFKPDATRPEPLPRIR